MATTRLVVVLLVLGTVLLLAVQNTATTLPLVFLGGRTVALPLGVWLVGAIGLGALTTVALTALLGFITPPKSGNRRYKYEPQAFYEPATDSRSMDSRSTDPRSAARSAAANASIPRSPASESRSRAAPSSTPPSETSGDWQAWTNLQSPRQWDDWEAMGRSSQANTPTSGAGQARRGWFGGQQQADPSQQVNESWQELSQDWGDLERHPYRASGVSPVEDSLEELTEGWDDIERSTTPAPPPHDFEAPQSPKQVYRDGSIYSYSYRDRGSPGQTDHIYAPPDDGSYETDLPEIEVYQADSRAEPYAPGDDRSQPTPDLDEDGVVDADYRVLIPPYDPSPTESTTQAATEEDDWGDTDDILSP